MLDRDKVKLIEERRYLSTNILDRNITDIKREVAYTEERIVKETKYKELPVTTIRYSFKDSYDNRCSIQESEATEPSIWFGMDKPELKLYLPDVDHSKKGYVDYPISDAVSQFSRMHLTQNQVKELLPYLEYFAIYGYLPRSESDIENCKTVSMDDIEKNERDKCVAKIYKYIQTMDNRLKYLRTQSGSSEEDIVDLVSVVRKGKSWLETAINIITSKEDSDDIEKAMNEESKDNESYKKVKDLIGIDIVNSDPDTVLILKLKRKQDLLIAKSIKDLLFCKNFKGVVLITTDDMIFKNDLDSSIKHYEKLISILKDKKEK